MANNKLTADGARVGVVRAERGLSTVLIYVRQSKSDYNPDGSVRGPSLNQQLDSVLQVPALRGLNYEHFSDANLSGKETISRPGYNAMMTRMRTAAPGEIAGIACYDQSRLHRDTINFLQFMAECEQHHVPVFDAAGLVPQSEKLTWTIKAAVATEERERIAKKVKDNLAYLIMTGKLLGHAPVGYRRARCEHRLAGSKPRCGCPQNKLELDPEAAPLVEQAFKLYATGKFSLQALAHHLNESGLAVPENRDFNKHRTRWHLGALKDILKNPSYLGKIRVGSELRPGNHPALIEQELFDQCHSVRALHKRRRTQYRHHLNTYPLQPLLICGRCGGKLQGHMRRELARYWYRCAGRASGGCDLPWIPGEALEDAMAFDLRRYVPGQPPDDALLGRLNIGLTKAPDPRASLKRLLTAAEAKEGRVKWMMMRGDLDQAEFMEMMTAINLERQAARQQAEQATRADLSWATERIESIVGMWQRAEPAQRGLMVAEVYSRIEVDRSGSTIEVVATPQPRWTPFFERVIRLRVTAGGKAKTALAEVGVNLAAQQGSGD